MRIRKKPQLADKPPSEIAEYIRQRWAGRAICGAELRAMYGLTPALVGHVTRCLREMGAIENARDHGEGITSWRIKP